MLQASQVEGAKRTVGTDRDENICGARKPCDVVDLTIVGDELGNRSGCVDVPDGAGGINRGCDYEAWGLFVP